MALYGLADCNNFFCSCERAFRPDLAGRPIVVLSNNDGCIIARSAESKAMGIKMGTPFYQVRDMLERDDVAVFSSNYTLYGDMSRRVMSILSRYSQSVDIYSIDEAFLDFSGMGGGLLDYARGMARRVERSTGIPISVGIAPTKTLAKLASKFAKKYRGYKGVCLMDTEEKRVKALSMCDVRDVWGIGRRFDDRLARSGVKTALDFTMKSADWVRHNFTVVGLRTWRELRGDSCISVDELPQKKSICTSRSFPGTGLSRLGDLEEAVANFAAACVRKMRESGLVAGALTVFAHTSRFRDDAPADYIHETVKFLTPTSALQEVVEGAVGVIRERWKGPEWLYKKAGVIVWDLTGDASVQLSLFDTVDRERLNSLQAAVDRVNKSNGHNTLRMAVQGYGKRWHLKNEHISRRFTTNIDDIIEVKA